jgi:hypothetical protein
MKYYRVYCSADNQVIGSLYKTYSAAQSAKTRHTNAHPSHTYSTTIEEIWLHPNNVYEIKPLT